MKEQRTLTVESFSEISVYKMDSIPSNEARNYSNQVVVLGMQRCGQYRGSVEDELDTPHK